MKFLIDMPLSPGLARWLINHGYNAVHALEIGLDRVSDAVILERARKERRVVVTADLDYPQLLASSHAAGPGLILFRGGNYSEAEALYYLRKVLAAISPGVLCKSIVVIEKNRIRCRRLPL
ncbi:MAG: DUF5615 family PIN-like protein [Syntrophothermus sp.]|uniref:DUF5615 family PIN-like protein n=1 Tax=Syntrophothermus sp. TaxID=2736299 RepID=UPI00257FD030|nr:DUF5615 family PIN-like protein [Syntrophothermus sp.]NSW84561.1 DUF5615 family PIN-like protein [Syntrophothermus sp.]